jgi:hypothetical protein
LPVSNSILKDVVFAGSKGFLSLCQFSPKPKAGLESTSSSFNSFAFDHVSLSISVLPVQKGDEVSHYRYSSIGRRVIAIAIEQIAIALTRTKALGWSQGISWVVENHIGTAGQHASQLLA